MHQDPHRFYGARCPASTLYEAELRGVRAAPRRPDGLQTPSLGTPSGDVLDDRPVGSAVERAGGLLSIRAVTLRTAQPAMRHSSLDLTMNVYTDPELLDVAGAINALPHLTVGERQEPTDGAQAAS